MSKRYWDGTFAVGLVLGLSLAVNVLVWLSVGWDWIDSEITSADPSGYARNKCSEQQAENAPANNAALKDKQAISADIGSPESNSRQSNEPDWCDLAAQQSMAYSTVRLKHAAWLTALFTLGGVLLLWRTLFLTRRTLDEAKETVRVTREIGEAQTRAWLTMEVVPKAFKVLENHSVWFAADVYLENIGHSPSLNISVMLKPVRHGQHATFAAIGADTNTAGVIFPGQKVKVENVIGNARLPFDEGDDDIPNVVNLEVLATYHSNGIEEVKVTACTYDITVGGRFAFGPIERYDERDDIRLTLIGSKTKIA